MNDKKPDLWSWLHLTSPPFDRSSETFRAWITIALLASGIAFIACTLLSAGLLVRLGWDAITAPAPIYQEAARHFLLAFAGAFGAPFLVWRAWVSHKQANAAVAQARVAHENHVTGIFSRSVELMGLERISKVTKDGQPIELSVPNTEARLGALYSLARLLEEGEKDQQSVLETLCAYIRENSRFQVPEPKEERSAFWRGDHPPPPMNRADVHAAVTIIGRRSIQLRERMNRESWRLDLRNSNLSGYDFSGLNLDRADFSNSFFNKSDFSGASFDNCIFLRTFFREANLSFVSMQQSLFQDCDMKAATINRTLLRNATLIQTDLRMANVSSIDISGANLQDAFSSTINYVLEHLESTGWSHYDYREVMSIYDLFQKATHDDNTSVSDAVRKALRIAILIQQRQNTESERSSGAQSGLSESHRTPEPP